MAPAGLHHRTLAAAGEELHQRGEEGGRPRRHPLGSLRLLVGLLGSVLHRSMYGSIQQADQPLLGNHHDTVDGAFKAAVFGFSDGLTTNINLVLAVALAQQTHESVIRIGVAGLLAGASSMACGEWLSAKAENDLKCQELQRERSHLQNMPDMEAQHMKEIMTENGLTPSTADAINHDIQNMPLDQQVQFHGKFELGIDQDEDGTSMKSTLMMWLSFAIGAAIPVLPWILTSTTPVALAGSIGGSVAGIVSISIYQVRGHWDTLPTSFLRNLLVTILSIATTVLFNFLFTSSR